MVSLCFCENELLALIDWNNPSVVNLTSSGWFMALRYCAVLQSSELVSLVDKLDIQQLQEYLDQPGK